MADELNTPNHRYYQNRYNVELAPNEMSKQWILASGIARIDNAVVLPMFAAAEPGVWYDPADINTLFQDSAGTTPVTGPNQQVGLMLDKSQGLMLGPELVTNGDFSQGSAGWTLDTGWSISGGAASINGTNTAASFLGQSTITTVVGRTYKVSFTYSVTSGSLRLNTSQFGNTAALTAGSSGIFTANLLAIGTTGNFNIQAVAVGTVATVDNISVKLLAGNHATQATSTQRPIYGINPITGTRNLLTYTEAFTNAAWLVSASTVTTSAAPDPNGGTSAFRIQLTASASAFVYQASASFIQSGQSYTISMWVRSNTGAAQTFRLFGNGTSDNSTDLTATTEWQRFTFSASASGGTSYGIRASSANGSADLLVWGAQLEQSATATAYQKVVSQYEVTEAGVQSASYLAFDGVDDNMVTGTITPATDKVQVFAGVRKLSDAALGMIAEFSADTNTNTGTWYLLAPVSNGTASSGWLSKGTLSSGSNATGFTAPAPAVLAGLGDISADLSIQRRNGSQVSQSTSDQGTGNYLAYPLYIGRRGGSTLPYNGRLYSLIVRFGPNLTTGQITSTESWVNSKTGAY